VKAGEEDKGIN